MSTLSMGDFAVVAVCALGGLYVIFKSVAAVVYAVLSWFCLSRKSRLERAALVVSEEMEKLGACTRSATQVVSRRYIVTIAVAPVRGGEK